MLHVCSSVADGHSQDYYQEKQDDIYSPTFHIHSSYTRTHTPHTHTHTHTHTTCHTHTHTHHTPHSHTHTHTQEYGITREEKLDIATQICTPLLCKIQADLHHTIMDEFSDINHRLDPRLSKGVISPNRHVRTRLYFTSESHVHTMLNILRYGGLVEVRHRAALPCLSSN